MRSIFSIILVVAMWSSASAANLTPDTIFEAARATAYLNSCPMIQPGSALIAVAKEIEASGKLGSDYFYEVSKVQLDIGIGKDAQRNSCSKARLEYGQSGDRRKDFVADKPEAKITLRRLASTNVELPEAKHGYDEVLLAAAYVLRAQAFCKNARVGDPFNEYIAARLITVRQLTEGHLAESVKNIDDRIDEWVNWQRFVYQRSVEDSFCTAVADLYGTNGRAKRFFVFFK